MSTSRRSFVKGATAAGMSMAAALAAATNVAFAETPAHINDLPESWDIETDVVVMGFGFAGEASAISAAAAGSQVQVFEKAPKEHAGGNSAVCCGYIQLASGEGAADYWRAIAWDGCPEDEVQAMAANVEAMPYWFNDNVFEVEISENDPDRQSKTFNGVTYEKSNVLSMKIETEYDKGEGYNKWHALLDVIEDRYADSITVNYDAPVTHLIFDPTTKEVFGVRAEIDGVEKTVKANKGVIMACGGFENNYDMVRDFVRQHYEQFQIGSPYNTGDGILMLMEIGAKLRHMAAVEYGSACQYDLSKQYHQSCSVWDAGDLTHMVYINNHGKRFYNENTRWPAHDKRYPEPCFIQEQPTLETANYPWWMVYDETRRGIKTIFNWSNPVEGQGWVGLHGEEDGIHQWSDDNLEEVDMGIVLMADTIEELGEKMGFEGDDLANFIDTITQYNENGANGEDPVFGRTPTKAEEGEDGVGMGITDGPFYATRVCLSYLNTNGGGDRTPEMQIKDWKGNPIPRLYEAGEFGSLFYRYYAGGGNVCEAFTNGMVAGQSVSALESWA